MKADRVVSRSYFSVSSEAVKEVLDKHNENQILMIDIFMSCSAVVEDDICEDFKKERMMFVQRKNNFSSVAMPVMKLLSEDEFPQHRGCWRGNLCSLVLQNR